KATMEAVRAATAAGDNDAFLACLSEASRGKLAEMHKMFDDFEKDHPELAGKIKRSTPADGLKEHASGAWTIGEEKITGETATLDVKIKNETYLYSFVLENGEWKIQLLVSDDAITWIKRGLDMLLKANEGLKDLGEKMGKEPEKK
ncbi:hypothetical protein ACFL09_04600, partial [Planctomycetota bacterium]